MNCLALLSRLRTHKPQRLPVDPNKKESSKVRIVTKQSVHATSAHKCMERTLLQCN